MAGMSVASSKTPESAIVIRNIETLAEMRAVEELQREVWGDEDVVPLTHLIAAREVGGILVGAFDGEVMAGFVYGFIGQEGAHGVIHSHMLAVKPGFRDRSLGYRLKLAQREQALSAGFERITWTFDPLQSRNAHLNFGRLGVVADSYRIDFYGAESPSALHRHIGTDRLWVTWLLKSERVRRRLESGPTPEQPAPAMARPVTLVEADGAGAPVLKERAEGLKGEPALIEIPGDIGSLQQYDPGLAVRWREATRHAFTEALASAYIVEEFYRLDRNGQRLGAYLLRRVESGETG
jgi:predicted GNAT superfamily acetyltransferase